MARIIYGVAGVGFGHSSRAHLVGQRFLDAGHEVMFVASGQSLTYLRSIYGSRVKEIFGLSFVYRRGRIDSVRTFTRNLYGLGRANNRTKKLLDRVCRPFEPDLMISDFEPFTAWWAWRDKIPLVGLDNEHLLTACRLEHPIRSLVHRLSATAVTRSIAAWASAYVVPNFFEAPLKRTNAVLVPPIVRPAVTTLKPSRAGHIVVYWTTGTEERRVWQVLRQFGGREFRVYGFNKDARVGNCLFKRPSTGGFLADMASADGIVTSAGFSLISECMYLRKKMLVVPLPGQYEQILNARYVAKLGLGLAARRLNVRVLGRFLASLEEPIPEDRRICWPNNDKFFRDLDEVLGRLDPPVSIAMPELWEGSRQGALAGSGC